MLSFPKLNTESHLGNIKIDNLQSTQVTNKVTRLAEEHRENEKVNRKKNILVLILQFLKDAAFINAFDSLQKDSGLQLNNYILNENIDLNYIMINFERHYCHLYDKYPRYYSSNKANQMRNQNSSNMLSNSANKSTLTVKNKLKSHLSNSDVLNSAVNADNANTAKRDSTEPLKRSSFSNKTNENKQYDNPGISLIVKPHIPTNESNDNSLCSKEDQHVFKSRLLTKPFPCYDNSDLNELANLIRRDILDYSPGIRFDDVLLDGKNQSAKQAIKESIIYPKLYPELFNSQPCASLKVRNGKIIECCTKSNSSISQQMCAMQQPWKGILLYGPPGTGKSMLAKAVATETNMTFFNISSSSIISKWRGDSEKLIRILFDLAHYYAPSVIFFDEIDSIMSTRGNSSEHEGSRRVKTELLKQIDGLNQRLSTNTVTFNDSVFIIAATNTPWDIESAVFRRLEKRILIDLPSHNTRALLINNFFKRSNSKNGDSVDNLNYHECATLTKGYSCSDILSTCKEARMIHIRDTISKIELLSNSNKEQIIKHNYVTLNDFKHAILVGNPSLTDSYAINKYYKWHEQYGSISYYKKQAMMDIAISNNEDEA